MQGTRPRNTAPRATARPEPGLHAALEQSAIDGRRQELMRAKAFARVDASSAFVFHGCASIGEYGPRIGYGSEQATEYAAAGRVLTLVPATQQLLLDGAMCISTLAILERLFTDDALRFAHKDGTAWTDAEIIEWARVRSDRDLRRAIRKREADVRSGERTKTRTIHLTAQGADDLERTQTLVSRKLGRFATQSEAAEFAFRDFVSRHDLLEQEGRARRAGPMPARGDGSKNPRYVPAEVRRGLMARHDDACAIRGCTHRIWLENSHHTAHAAGGGNELVDQDRLCGTHHRMKDHGEIVWVPPHAGARGHYRTREGAILRLRSPAPNDAACGGERPADTHDARERGKPSATDGALDGALDGSTNGSNDGTTDGTADGTADGSTDGTADGSTNGSTNGSNDGTSVIRERGPLLHPSRRDRARPSTRTARRGRCRPATYRPATYRSATYRSASYRSASYRSASVQSSTSRTRHIEYATSDRYGL